MFKLKLVLIAGHNFCAYIGKFGIMMSIGTFAKMHSIVQQCVMFEILTRSFLALCHWWMLPVFIVGLIVECV